MNPTLERCVRIIIWTIVFIIVLSFCGEEYLWRKGYDLPEYDSSDVLGWSGWGKDVVSSEDPNVTEHSFPNKQRRSHADPARYRSFRAAVFGDSYTYGAGVRDEDTYCWKLNELFPSIRFDNYGVGGYGPYQCYLSMCDVLKRMRYDLVIYSVWTGHIERNTLSQRRRFDLINADPWVELKDGRLIGHMPNVGYRWARKSRVLSFIKRAVYGFMSKEDMPENDYNRHVFTLMLRSMSDEVKRHGIPFVCFLLNDRRDNFIDRGELTDVNIADISIMDLLDANNTKYRVRRMPRFHPNAEAHSIWAKRMADYLKAHKLVPADAAQPQAAVTAKPQAAAAAQPRAR